MGKVLAIARKELHTYFGSPIAYIAISIYLLLVGITFFFKIPFLFPKDNFFVTRQATLRPLFEWSIVLFAIILPAVSMRLISEEKKDGTMEILLTMPVSDFQVVLGKFLGALVFLGVALLLTVFYAILVFSLGKPDIGPLIGGYFGVFLMGGAFLAIGLMASAWTKSQIVAFIIALLISAFFVFADRIPELFGLSQSNFFNIISFNYHFESIARGVLDSRDIIFFLSVIAVALELTRFTLESRKWR